MLFIHNHHDIICRFIVYQQVTITVIYKTASRILYLFQESIGVSILLIVITHNLQNQKA